MFSGGLRFTYLGGSCGGGVIEVKCYTLSLRCGFVAGIFGPYCIIYQGNVVWDMLLHYFIWGKV